MFTPCREVISTALMADEIVRSSHLELFLHSLCFAGLSMYSMTNWVAQDIMAQLLKNDPSKEYPSSKSPPSFNGTSQFKFIMLEWHSHLDPVPSTGLLQVHFRMAKTLVENVAQ